MSRNRYAHLLGAALDHPWAIAPSMLPVIAMVIAQHLAGVDADPATIAAAKDARKDNLPQPVRGGLAVVPVHGVIAPRMNLLSEMSGGTSFDALTRAVLKAGDDPTVSTILLDIDSPGGSVAGATEFAATLRGVRTKKPVIASVNYQAASAAYWLAANATKIHVAPSGMVGSVGVYTMHNDLTEAMAQLGIKREFIAAGKYKLEGQQGVPLTDEGRDYIRGLVTKSYDRFVGDIAKGRGVTPAAVRSGYGEGRIVEAEDALAAGMVDRIETLSETVARLLPPGAALISVDARSLADTSQEPSPATDQDSRATRQWQFALERELFEWSLT